MRALIKQNIEDILFIDIETAPLEEELTEDSILFPAWEYYCINNKIEDVLGSYSEMAGLFAEFSKIICVTIGVVRGENIHIKTFSGDEKELLTELNTTLDTFVNHKTYLCGHAVVGFDGPFIMRRCLVNQVPLNQLFDVAHLKPWEVNYLDTAQLWKSTGFKASSLISVATALGLPSPKEDISGRDVGRVYYEGGLDRIIKYCERDVVSVVNIVRKLRYEEPLSISETIEEKPPGLITYLYNGGKYTKDVKEKLQGVLKGLNKTDRTRAIEILNSLPTKAKGRETYITKKDIEEL